MITVSIKVNHYGKGLRKKLKIRKNLKRRKKRKVILKIYQVLLIRISTVIHLVVLRNIVTGKQIGRAHV